MFLASRSSFNPAQRLRRRQDFERVYRSRQKCNNKEFVVYYCANDLLLDRLGLTVSRRFGGAVLRNRAKRLLRELFRTNTVAGVSGADLVVKPNRSLLETEFTELERRWRQTLRKIRKRLHTT